MDVAASDERADALRSAELVGGEAEQIGAKLRDVDFDAPGACTASTCSTPPTRCTISAISAIGWITPVSLLASITDTSGRSACCEAAGKLRKIEPAVAIDRQFFDVVRRKAPAAQN